MQPHRLPFHYWVVLLVPVLTAAAQPPQTSDEPVRNELGTLDEEPRIALPEHRARTPFTTVSRTRRKNSRDPLITLTQQAVDTTTRRLLSTEQHTPWQMMHALLGLREDFRLLHQDKPISGLEWISQGQVFNNEHWFEKTPHGGRAHPYSVPYAFEGHANQFLAILSMCGIGLDAEFGTADGTITMRDMIHNAQMTLSEKDEPTWTLWALSRYLPPTATWRNAEGELWSIERLVQIQTAKPMRGAPCGGTHGLFALAHARNVYLRQGKPLRGTWLMAERKIRQHIYTARMQQNSNGSLSSNFFRGRQYDRDFNKRMASAGHILEFLMIALPQKELNQRWVRRAIESTARDLLNNRKAFVKCSPLYHSVNALNIYLDRVNPKVKTETPSEDIAATDQPKRTASLGPKPADPSTPGLKSVPATQISRSKDAASATEDKSDDNQDSGHSEIAGDKADSNVADSGSNGPMPKTADSPPASAPETIGPLPAVTDLKTPTTKSTDPEQGWAATPSERRTTIADAPKDQKTDRTDDPSPSSEPAPTKAAPLLLPPKTTTPETSSVDKTGNDADDETAMTPSADAPAEPKPSATPDATTDQQQPSESSLAIPPAEPDNSEPEPSRGNPIKSVSRPKVLPEETQPDTTGTGTPDADPAEEDAPTAAATPEPSSEPDAAESADQDAAGKADEAPQQPKAEPEDEDADDQVVAPLAPLPTLKKTPEPATSATGGRVPAGINQQFLAADLNPSDWLQRFEIESREVFAARGAILSALQLQPNMSVADIGAGTGLFVGLMSHAVGEEGHVYAIDISPRLVDFVHRRVMAEQLGNVSVVRNDQHGLRLGNQKVDRMLVCDTYHHFEYHADMLQSMYRHLHPGGEVVLVDFERDPQSSRSWILQHVRADKQTFRDEFLAAGFEFVEEVSVPEFRENYLLRFRRPFDAN